VLKKFVNEWVLPTIIAALAVVFIRSFLFGPFRVHGLSMYPTLYGEEFVMVNLCVYKFKKPSYGDIVVFHTSEERDFIKRVIGVEGDRIRIENQKVYRNGKELFEPYITQPTIGPSREVIVPKDEIYVLGDNRTNSKDSRLIGTVKLQDVVGRAEFVFFPFSRLKILSCSNCNSY